MYTNNSSQHNFYPKRPLHSFQDLEVYQKTLECSVLVAKKVDEWVAAAGIAPDVVAAFASKSRKGTGSIASIKGNVGSGIRQGTGSATAANNIGTGTAKEFIVKNLVHCALGIPHQVAEAHSLRFGDHTAGIAAIEKAMLNCNKMIVYLEQFRDICDTGIAWEFFDEVIKKYLYVRRKMLHLEQAWKKFMPGHRAEV